MTIRRRDGRSPLVDAAISWTSTGSALGRRVHGVACGRKAGRVWRCLTRATNVRSALAATHAGNDGRGRASASAAGRGIIVDSRAPERYRGEVEPLDPVAGHIPGAVNLPWQGNVGPDGLMLDTHALAQRFASIMDNKEGVIVHCGSGVTGCLNVLALERAGVSGVKLYVGGWSEWCSHPDDPVAVGAES